MKEFLKHNMLSDHFKSLSYFQMNKILSFFLKKIGSKALNYFYIF